MRRSERRLANGIGVGGPAGNSLDSTELLAGGLLAMAIAIIILDYSPRLSISGNTAWATWTLFSFLLRGVIAPSHCAGIT